MKPTLLFIALFLVFHSLHAQSPDYITVKKKNGRIIKSFYAGSEILLQTTDGNYLQGPISIIRNDSVFVTLHDIRRYQTTFGSIIKDTISTQTIGLKFSEIKRIHLSQKQGFFERQTGPILMIGGAGYIALNLINSATARISITEKRNLRSLGIAAGAFGLGYFISKLFSSDGFSKKKHRIEYVDL